MFAHTKHIPHFYKRPAHHKNPPAEIFDALNSVKRWYFKSSEYLFNIISARLSERAIRSESRESILSIISVILNTVDLADFNIVDYRDGGRYPLSVVEIAKLAGIGIRRCFRALAVLREAGYITLYHRTRWCEKTQSLKAMVAIKKVSNFLFYHLGIGAEKLANARQFALLKLERFKKKLERMQQSTLGQKVDTLVKGMTGGLSINEIDIKDRFSVLKRLTVKKAKPLLNTS